jgi:putative phosphoribosyl transferase
MRTNQRLRSEAQPVVTRFRTRADAGRQLADRLTAFEHRSDVLVLGLPRGGIPVAFEVVLRLQAPLDVCLVRKLGVPGHPELAMGAIAADGVEVLSAGVIRDLGIPPAEVERAAVRERLELDRRDRLYRGGRPAPLVSGYTVILVDDGLATGSTMEAAIVTLRKQRPAAIVVAVPVAAADACERMRQIADQVVCLSTPAFFDAVGRWYDDFGQNTDDEVIRLLAEAAQRLDRQLPR